MAARKKPSLAAQLAAERKARREEEELTSQMARALGDEFDARVEDARESALAKREARVEGARAEFAVFELEEREGKRKASARAGSEARSERARERRVELAAEVVRVRDELKNPTVRGVVVRVQRWWPKHLDAQLKAGEISKEEYVALRQPRKRPGRKLVAKILEENGSDRTVRASRP